MAITVHCPSCATSFPVDPAKIPERGVSARCSSCRTIFRVDRPVESLDPFPTEDVAAFEVSAPGTEAPRDTGWEREPAVEAERPEKPGPEPAFPAEADVEASGAVETGGTAEAPAEEGAEAEPGTDASEIASDDNWVFQTEEQVDASALEITPMGTVESTVEETRDELNEDSFFVTPAGFETSEDVMEDAEETDEETYGAVWDEGGVAEEEAEALPPEPEAEAADEARADVAEEESEALPPEPQAEAAEEPHLAEAEREPTGSATPKTFAFGHRDPHDKARRLARVLVSDMIMYNPDRHARALAAGTLKADFEDEIQKSWKEYVEQVGDEIANNTTYWPDALNDVLAQGQQVF